MLLLELFEAGAKHVTFCFGRMNPPTIGHKQVLDTMKSQGGDMRIFVSQTQDKKKNPLDYATKIKFIKEMFPEYAGDVVDNAGLNTIGKVASYLYEQGYTAATFVAGSDRLEDMKNLLTQYNGVEGKAHGFYDFEVLDFVSSGEREDGAEGVAGVSASGARLAAANNDFKGFQEATGAGELAKPLFAAVRKGMGINESTINELADDDAYFKFILTKIKTDRPLSQKEKEFFKSYQMKKDVVKSISPLYKKNEGTIKELKNIDSRPEDNFTIDDIKSLEKETDIETMKSRAKEMVNRASKKRMKAEKILWFMGTIDRMTSRMALIKLMYDLYLAGEGHKVIGSKYSMNPNSYRQKFGDDIDVDEGWKSKAAAAALAAANLLSPAQAAEEPTKPITIAYVMIDGEVRKYNLGDKFSNAKEAEKFISGILDKQGLQGYTLDIKHGYPKKKDIDVKEAPIEMDPADPMDPMIHSHDKANPAKLKYRMLRAAGQLKDLASRAENASPSEWQLMARQFEELKMNMEQIRHALDELGKIKRKGGIRSRGITV
jgi:hypothetical protein